MVGLIFCTVAARGADIRGIYLYSEHPENAKDQQELLQALHVPGVDGVAILIGWKQLEPSRGQYTLNGGGADLLDTLVNAAAAAGKKIDLAIRAGQDTPDWLFTQGAVPLDFEVAPLEGDVPSGTCNAVRIAAPWDPVFQSEWSAMLATVAKHLHDTGMYDRVVAVRLTGINRTTAELRLPAEILTKPCTTNSVATWLQAGYRPALLLQAWDKITDMFAVNFPDKIFTLPIIPSASGNGNREYPFPPIDDNGCAYQPPWPAGTAVSCTNPASSPSSFPPVPDQNAALLSLASRKFPGRLVVAYQNLDLRFPAQPYVLYAAQTWGTMSGFQTNDYIGPFQQAACSVVNGQFGSCDSPTYLSLLEIGIHAAAQYIEVLPPDAIAFPDAILRAHAELAPPERRRAAKH
jgi:hypothetical protein